MAAVAALARTDPSTDPAFLLECLEARAQARALLWFNWEIAELHDAVDPLWRWAVERGLVDFYGTDIVQEGLSRAFDPYRGDLYAVTA